MSNRVLDFSNAISQNDYEIIYNENRSEITDPKNGLLPEDILTFCCEVKTVNYKS